MTETPDDFDGCMSRCRRLGRHTLKWGECEHGVRPAPTLAFWRVFTASDGSPSMAAVDLDAALFVPWIRRLPVDGQWEFLEQLADANAEDRPGIVERYRRAAEPEDEITGRPHHWIVNGDHSGCFCGGEAP